MRIFRSYVYRLYLTNKQKVKFYKFYNETCDFFNMLISFKNPFTKKFNLNELFNIRPELKLYNQNLILNVYKVFLKLKNSLPGQKSFQPKNIRAFPKKIKFSVSESGQPVFSKNYVFLPSIGKFKLKLHRPLPKKSFVLNVIIEERLKDVFYINFGLVINEKINYKIPLNAVGLDYSSPNFYHTNENELGKMFIVRNFNEDKIGKIRRKMSRCELNSNNYIKYKDKLEKLSRDVSNKRDYMLHKAANYILSKYDLVGLETLSMVSIASHKHLGKHTYENAYTKFCQILEYKAQNLGKFVEFVPKYFPSSQLCSSCGVIHKDLSLNDRIIKCECGIVIDRDLNAAINIKNKAIDQFEQKYKNLKKHALSLKNIN